MNERDFLRHHTEIDGIAPEIFVGVNAETIAAASHQHDVTLEANIRWEVKLRIVDGVGTVTPGPAAMNTGVAALPGHRGCARHELPTDAGHHRLELVARVGTLRQRQE